jgi:flagellar hook-associated protein 1 FlgK
MSIQALEIALSGLEASQTGLDATSENLANASTAGYISQAAEFAPVAGGPGPVGSGVEVQAVVLDANPALQLLEQSTAAQAGSASALAGTLQAAEAVFTDFPAVGASSTSSSAPAGNGLQASLSAFWSAWSTLANSPGSLASRTAVVGSAQSVVDTLHSMSSSLASAAQGAEDQLANLLTQVNQQLAELANVNEEVLAAGAAQGGTNALTEQQISLANELASELGATNSTNAQGSMTLMVGSMVLVSGPTAQSIAVSGSGASTQLTVGGSAAPVTSGQAAGLLQAITSELPSWQSSLDNVAQTLANDVNGQLQAGVYWTPVGSASATPSPGIPMFQSSSGGTITASDIEVSPTIAANPGEVAAGSSASAGPLDGSNAQAVANLASSTSGADALYQSLVGQAGSATEAALAARSVTAQAASAAADRASAAEGVDTNAQLTNLLQYQQMFSASAKVIGTAAGMLNSLLAEVQ